MSQSDSTDRPNPGAQPGWYRDPSAVATQRYWDGKAWTDQHAPMEPPREYFEATPRFGIALLGAVLLVVALFLPVVEDSGLPLKSNSVFQASTKAAVVFLLLAVASVLAAYVASERRGIRWELIALGAVTMLDANYVGGAEQLVLYSEADDSLVQGSAGLGVWTIAGGGFLIVVAGLTWWRTPET